MKSLLQLLSLSLLISLTLATAQTGTGKSTATGNTGTVGVAIFSGTFPEGEKGVPFSADVVTETDQVLADGNHIHREIRGKIYRDSQGRMRRETMMEFAGSGVKYENVSINDPTQRVFINLDPRLKTATIHHFVQVGPPSTDRAAAKAVTPAAVMRQSISKHEPLGNREIEGFTATGSRYSRTIEAGQVGNEKPITSVHETWFCRELRTELLSISDDPQSGRHTMHLTNIQTGEPDPLLFQVPPDYTVKEN